MPLKDNPLCRLMDVFIARQPIFNRHRKVQAYELLYRGTRNHSLSSVTGERATTSLLSSTFITEGVEIISGTRPCYVNFTEDLLLKKIPLAFPKTKVVVEILEDVRPSEPVIKAVRQLSQKGYTIALDDFVYSPEMEPLILLADIVKIDFRLSPIDEILKTIRKLERFDKLKLLAEKVETIEEFDKAAKMGFTYFQGFFFSKPETIRIRDLEASKLNLISLLAEVTQPSTTLERLHHIIARDVAISYKLLRFLNSAYFYLIEKVTTVKHAIAYLGEKELRRFIILVLVSKLSSEKPDELIRLALMRARFCELLAEGTAYEENAAELYLLGLFSVIDVMLDTTMPLVVNKLPLSDPVKTALIDNAGEYAIFLDISEAYERLQPKKIKAALELLGKDQEKMPAIYLEAAKYANALM